MCFRFGSCFGSCSGQDYGWSTPKTTHRGGGGGGRSHWGSLADHGYYSGADHKPAYHHPTADNELVHNAGGVPKDHVDDAGGHGAYAPYAQDKAGGMRRDHVDDSGGHGAYAPYAQDKADATSKHPAAWSSKVGDDAGHACTGRLHEDAAGYHHYPITTTTNLAR